jgi:hypothetical protein
VTRPNFFIVGAPKCGTTALYAYLRQHPDVFMPDTKEPNFFGTDLERRRSQRLTEDQYLSLFEPAGDAKRIGEASVRYLYSRTAAREIAEFAPGALAIIMLRDPVEVMYSMHAELVFSGAEDLEDFAEALAAEDDRRAGLRIPPGANKPSALFYRDTARFAQQVERYFDVFGRERVHAIVYDDFHADPLDAYRGTLRFLTLDDSFAPRMDVVNPSKRPRSRLVQRLIQRPPGLVRGLVRAALPAQRRKRMYRAAKTLNARAQPRQPMDPELRRRLREEFAPEVDHLGTLLGRDLSAWSRT